MEPKIIINTTWKVSAPFGGANPHFLVPEEKKYFESLAEQGLQNKLPSRVINADTLSATDAMDAHLN